MIARYWTVYRGDIGTLHRKLRHTMVLFLILKIFEWCKAEVNSENVENSQRKE